MVAAGSVAEPGVWSGTRSGWDHLDVTTSLRTLTIGLVVMGTVLVASSLPTFAAPEAATGGEVQVTSTSLQELPEGAGHIIQQPNSGVSPEDSGDRGGAGQILLFVVLVVAVAGGVGLVTRESRRKRRRA